MTKPTVIALPAIAVPAPPPWRDWIAELWWLLGFADDLLLATLRGGVRAARAIPHQARLPLAAVALCGYMAVRAVTGYLADPRPIMAVLAWPLLVVLGFLLFCAWGCSGLAPIRIRGGHGNYTTVRRTIGGNTKIVAHYAASPTKPRTDKMTATHEGGHAAAAAHVGGRPLEARAYADGSGWCSAILPSRGTLKDRVIRYSAFIAGGEVAVHSRSGCGTDQALLKWAIGKLPAREQRPAWYKAYGQARAAQSAQHGVQRKVSRALLTRGRWGGGGEGRYGI